MYNNKKKRKTEVKLIARSNWPNRKRRNGIINIASEKRLTIRPDISLKYKVNTMAKQNVPNEAKIAFINNKRLERSRLLVNSERMGASPAITQKNHPNI
jgi:hypothetical protein